MKGHIITAVVGGALMIAGGVASILAFENGMNGPMQLTGMQIFMLGGCGLIKGAGDAIVELDDKRHSLRIRDRKKDGQTGKSKNRHEYHITEESSWQ